MKVNLLGYGRYGQLAFKKYSMNTVKGANLESVIEKNIEAVRPEARNLLGNIPLYRDINEVPQISVQDSVFDLALLPQIILDMCKKLVDKGVRKFILPKPVSTNAQDFQALLKITEGSDALVASNWHYADITKLTKTLLDKLTGKTVETTGKLPEKFVSQLNNLSENYEITGVKVDYNKRFEKLDINPPLQELPHALQIVHSTGCIDLSDASLFMNESIQTKSRVNVILQDNNTNGHRVLLNSDLRDKNLNDLRERLLKVYLENSGEKVVVTVDYDARFDQFGRNIKPQSIKYESLTAPETNWEYTFVEDNMQTMYNSMFEYFGGVGDNGVLTLQKYGNISEILFQIEEMWKILKQ